MNAPRRDRRLEGAREVLARERADWLLIPASADFVWLTGGHARVTERLVLFALPAAGDPFALVPRLEAEALGLECPWLALEVWEEDESPIARLARRIGDARALLLGEGFRTGTLLALAARAECRPAAPVLAPLRAVKDAEEQAHMLAAARHADRVVAETAASLRPGMTERQVTAAIFARFEALGQTDPWAIVAGGANAAFPHHSSSERALVANECVLLDLGAYHEGYGSDITRTFWLGRPPEEFAKVYRIVDEARAAG